MKKVSIIIPVYNVEMYLRICIESVIKQTYEQLEILLVDDGSTDSSPEICDEYAQKDSRIRVIHKPNGGLSDARNTGIDAATGEFLFFVDSDDYIHPSAVSTLAELMQEEKADTVIGSYQKIDDYVLPGRLAGNTFIYAGGEEILELYKNQKADATVAVAKLYDRKLFQDVRFPVGKVHEDEFVTYRILFASKRIVYTEKVIYYYLQRQGSIMNSGLSARELDLMDMCAETVEFYVKNGANCLADLNMQRALFLSKMLVNRYGDIGDKENQGGAYSFYRKYWRMYHRKCSISLARRIYYFLFYMNYRLGNFAGRVLQKIFPGCMRIEL